MIREEVSLSSIFLLYSNIWVLTVSTGGTVCYREVMFDHSGHKDSILREDRATPEGIVMV